MLIEWKPEDDEAEDKFYFICPDCNHMLNFTWDQLRDELAYHDGEKKKEEIHLRDMVAPLTDDEVEGVANSGINFLKAKLSLRKLHKNEKTDI